MAHLRVVSSYPDQADPPDHEVDSQDDEEVDLDAPTSSTAICDRSTAGWTSMNGGLGGRISPSRFFSRSYSS